MVPHRRCLCLYLCLKGLFADKILIQIPILGRIHDDYRKLLAGYRSASVFSPWAFLSLLSAPAALSLISLYHGRLEKMADRRWDAGFSFCFMPVSNLCFPGWVTSCVAIGKGNIFRGWSMRSSMECCFWTAAVGMIISLIDQFLLSRPALGPISLNPDIITYGAPGLGRWTEYTVYIGTLLLSHYQIMVSKPVWIILWPPIGPVTFDLLVPWDVKVTDKVKEEIVGGFDVIFFSILFWESMNRVVVHSSIFAVKASTIPCWVWSLIPMVSNNSAGAFFIIALDCPLFGLMWLWMAKRI